MAFKEKYKLVSLGYLSDEGIEDTRMTWNNRTYRIQALRDIPEHDVKAGDLGGIVIGSGNLSQKDSCWIAYGAKVLGRVRIKDEAYIGDFAKVINYSRKREILISEKAQVRGRALVMSRKDSENYSLISGVTIIADEAKVIDTRSLSNGILVYGKALLDGCDRISGVTEIYGNAVIKKGVSIGSSEIYGNAVIENNAEIYSSRVFGEAIVRTRSKVTSSHIFNKAVIGEGEEVLNQVCDLDNTYCSPVNKRAGDFLSGNHKKEIAQPKTIAPDPAPETIALDQAPAKVTELSEDAKDALDLFEEVKGKIESYESDIVKIIKYPAMTDRTDALTREMARLLNLSSRYSAKPESEKFVNAVNDLENAFLAAESNALRIASTALSESDKKKAGLAKDLLAIAGNESSPENEKKVAFKQAFKQLEGVVVVPESAIDAFRVKIGLKELES